MFHYLFTNDLRIANLQEMLTEAGACFATDTVPSASENKSKNNNFMTLGFYFNLTTDSNCAKACANGDVRKVVLNFIKKFQFPNPRTTESLNDCINDGITLAPMRTVIKILYMMNLIGFDNPCLTRTEIARFIFFDESIAKNVSPDLMSVINRIKENRESVGIDEDFPSEDTLKAKGYHWAWCERQIREMVKILCWSGCVKEDFDGRIRISHSDLTRENEADIFEIINYNDFWKPDVTKNASGNKESYQEYMDIEYVELQSSESNEKEFKQWLSTIKKSNGETYSFNTINHYMNAIKSIPNDFPGVISPYTSMFEIMNLDSLNSIRKIIESADNYAEVNASRGNGALSACLELYCSFLEAKESEKDDNIFTPEWFSEKAANYPELDSEANNLATEFLNRFSIEYLSSLSGTDLLNNIFLNDQNADNLCRVLEFNAKNREIFGSISGGTAYKYGLFFSPNQKTWMTGSSRKPQSLTEDEAIALGSEIRDRLVAGAKAIQEFGELNTIGDYKELYETLSSVTKGDIDKVWFMKYYQMLYPKYFATNYSDFAQRTILDAIGLDKEKYAFVRMGQLRFFADKCGISNVMLNKIFWQYYTESEIIEDKPETTQDISFHTGYETKFARNRILFGAPGTGKSFTINNEKNELLANGGEYERITFHPDYSYANFVGTYKPVPFIDNEGKDAITYSYVPGPFMRTYVKALKNSRTPNAKPFLLIIEEINRANVAAVFGDVFQLLDRDDEEKSEYPIQATEDIKKYLADELGGVPVDYAEIRIPDNMFIWATMNSADQGVFPMDTAFKRRWDFTYLGIDDSEEGIVGKVVTLGKGNYERTVEWNELRKAINEELLTYKVNEDKLMGPYFISKKVMPEGTQIDAETFIRVFKNKVIMYLFDDAAKQKRHSLFAGCDEKTRTQYSKICDEFEKRGVAIFCNAIKDRFIPEEQGDE